MKFGLQHPNFTYDGEGASIVDSLGKLATSCENVGFDSFWVMDHFHQIPYVGQPEEPMLEGWTTLGVVAGLTSKIKLGTLVTGNAYRHPSVLAKIGATLDVLSKGRLFMGIGAAWNEDEASAYGIPFPPLKERFRRLEEALQIIRAMWTQDTASFDGNFYHLRNAHCNPKPIQKPHPPIMIGGSGERETLKLVAKYGDACNLFGSVDTVKHKLAVLRNHCKDVGRDYNSILKTKLGRVLIAKDKEDLKAKLAQATQGVPEERVREFLLFGTPEEVHRQLEDFRDAGIDYFIIGTDPQHELEYVDLFGREIAKKF